MRFLALTMASLLLVACGRIESPSPTASPLDLPAVTAALRNAGIAVVDVADNLSAHDGAWQCLPGAFRLSRVSQQAPAAYAPGAKPPVEILLFSSEATRTAAQATIGSDGQVRVQGCATIVEWLATPHVVGVRNVLLVVVTEDRAAIDAVKAAASHLGG